MALTAINRRRIQQLSHADFIKACAKLNAEWMKIGCPDVDGMPRGMLAEWLALREEHDRRGLQLSLF